MDVLLQLDLHLNIARVEQRHQRMIESEVDQVESAIAFAGLPIGGLMISTFPVVPLPTVDACGFEIVQVANQGAREGHLRTQVRQSKSRLHRVTRPSRVKSAPLVVHIDYAKRKVA